MIERASKAAAMASVVLIVPLLLWFHPDITWALRIAGGAAFAAAWFAGRWRAHVAVPACVLAAVVSPALLRLATGREQPVLDIVWMAALAGALVRGVSWSRWTLPAVWRPLAGGWALTLALAWPVLAAREIGFDPGGLRDFGAVVSWAYWPAPHAVSWTLYWVLIQLLGLLWLDWMRERLLEQPGRLPNAVRALVIGTSAATAVAIVQGTVDLGFLNPPLWAADGRATGTMLEANGFAHAAAIAGPVSFVILRSTLPHAPGWAWTSLLAHWVGLWMSGSRSGALLCGVAGAIGLGVALWRSGEIRIRQALATAALLLPAAAILIVFADVAGPVQRLAQIDRGNLMDLWERGGYGSIAVQMVREYPLTGTGTGTFHYLAPDYERVSADNALNPDNAQNWWRHQAAELGLFGGALVLIWSAVLAWQVLAWRPRFGAPPSEGGAVHGPLAAPVVRALLIGIGLSSLIGMPTQNPVVLIWFFTLVAWLSVLGGGDASSPAPGAGRWSRAAWIAALVLPLAYAGGHLWLGRTSLSVAARAIRFEREYVAGAYQPEELPELGEFRWTDDESRFVLPAATPWLVVRVWASHPDIEEHPVQVTLSTPCGVLWGDSLATTDAVTVGIRVPDGVRSVDARLQVGRTWQPSAYGSEDTRRLGVSVSTSFRELDPDERKAYTLSWPVCPP